MKKIIRLAVVLLCAALTVGCDGPKKADTLAKDIIDQWHLVENPLISNSTEDIIDVYVEFKLDGTFTLYQKDFSTPIYYNVYIGISNPLPLFLHTDIEILLDMPTASRYLLVWCQSVCRIHQAKKNQESRSTLHKNLKLMPTKKYLSLPEYHPILTA